MQISPSFTPASANSQYPTPLLTPEGQTEHAPEVQPASGTANGSLARDNVVQLSAGPDWRPEQPTVATYAEIWKDGQKVAEVDVYGGVTAHSGMIAATTSNPGGGPELAARRAAQIALAIGGEIRSAGQVVDRPTLLMRARLQSAYGY